MGQLTKGKNNDNIQEAEADVSEPSQSTSHSEGRHIEPLRAFKGVESQQSSVKYLKHYDPMIHVQALIPNQCLLVPLNMKPQSQYCKSTGIMVYVQPTVKDIYFENRSLLRS